MSSSPVARSPETLDQALGRLERLIAAQAWEEADSLAGQVFRQAPDDLRLILHRAAISGARGRVGEAIRTLGAGLTAHPGHPTLLLQLGAGLGHAGLWTEAIERLDQALFHAPDWPPALFQRGSILLAAGRPRKARADFARLLAIDGGNLPARQQWQACNQARSGSPRETPSLMARRAQVLLALGRPAGALADLDAALRRSAPEASLHNNRGLALFELERFDEALAGFDAALTLMDPADPVAAGPLLNRGRTLVELGRPVDALIDLDQALSLRPGDPGILFNQAMARFLTGDWTRAWGPFEHRWSLPEMLGDRRAPGPQWTGEADLAGRTLLITVEQGFGDTLQFCRYAQLAHDRGARVLLEAQPALIPLLTSLKGVDRLIERGAALPDHDLHCPMLSLPGAFGTTEQTAPARTPYLSAPPLLTAAWRKDLRQSGAFNVGLAWSGNPGNPRDPQRSLSAARLAPLFSARPDLRFHALQPGVKPADRQALPDLIVHPDDRLDFSGTAGLIEALDLVISVDTAMAHLAGALDRPVWILLPFAADWRWKADGAATAWYPSARLFRQARRGDWRGVIDLVCRALADMGPSDLAGPNRP
ncbi:MAG: tetratricopeptide repeat protein [Caulobacter sp.]|nr:tetratricopeptide repeat protein [Caulobacter sp.]